MKLESVILPRYSSFFKVCENAEQSTSTAPLISILWGVELLSQTDRQRDRQTDMCLIDHFILKHMSGLMGDNFKRETIFSELFFVGTKHVEIMKWHILAETDGIYVSINN